MQTFSNHFDMLCPKTECGDCVGFTSSQVPSVQKFAKLTVKIMTCFCFSSISSFFLSGSDSDFSQKSSHSTAENGRVVPPVRLETLKKEGFVVLKTVVSQQLSQK